MRGWILQELIASQVVLFLSADWRTLGSKSTLTIVIEEITDIERCPTQTRDTVNRQRRQTYVVGGQTGDDGA